VLRISDFRFRQLGHAVAISVIRRPSQIARLAVGVSKILYHPSGTPSLSQNRSVRPPLSRRDPTPIAQGRANGATLGCLAPKTIPYPERVTSRALGPVSIPRRPPDRLPRSNPIERRFIRGFPVRVTVRRRPARHVACQPYGHRAALPPTRRCRRSHPSGAITENEHAKRRRPGQAFPCEQKP
jgi:hypothetical protein